MTQTADELAVYDGRTMIGTRRRNGPPHAFVAKALDGKRLGTFPDQAAATHAVRCRLEEPLPAAKA